MSVTCVVRGVMGVGGCLTSVVFVGLTSRGSVGGGTLKPA